MSIPSTTSYQANDILTDRGETTRSRVLFVFAKHTWLFDMDRPLSWPRKESTPDLMAQVQAGDYFVVKSPVGKSVADNAMARARQKKARFDPALQLKAELFTGSGRGVAYKLFKDDLTMTRRTFDRALREWWAGGMRMLGFVPHWDRCGVRAIDTKDLEKVPLAEAKRHALAKAVEIGESPIEYPETLPDCTADGMPRERHAPAAASRLEVDRKVLRVFKEYYDWKLGQKGRNLNDARRRMEAEVFRVENADGTYTTLPAAQLVSDRTFRHWFYILNDHKVRRVAQVGDKEYNTEEREQLGDEPSAVQRAGEVCSGDATVWNISVVSRFAGRRVVGCPIVFRIRCKRTGMLMGLAVTLASASWTGMAAAISNCVEDKVKFCARYGIAIRPEDWPIQGLMGTLEVDRGETDNHHPNAFIELTGVTVLNLQGGRPDIKPGVESDWRTLQVRMNGKTPSALVDTWEKSQNSKWKLQGEMDIDQFTELLLIHELDRMKQSRKTVLLDPEITAAGLTSSPLHMWDYSIQNEGGSLSSFDLDEIQLSLLRRKEGRITERGVYFKGCYYVAKKLSQEHAFARARRRGNAQAEVAYEVRLVDRIYLTSIEGHALDEPIACDLNLQLDSQRSYLGKCFAEVMELQRKQSINDRDDQENQHQSAQKALRGHAAVLAESNAMKAQSTREGESDAAQLKAMAENRKQEMYLTEPQKAFRPEVDGDAPTGNVDEPSEAPQIPVTTVEPAPDQAASPTSDAPVKPGAPGSTAPRFRLDDVEADDGYTNYLNP